MLPSMRISPPSGRSRPAMQRSVGGLAAAGRPKQRHELARRDRKIDVVDRPLGAEMLAEVVELDHGFAGRAHGCTASVLGIQPQIHLVALAQAVARMGDHLPLEIAPAHPAIDVVAEENRLQHLALQRRGAAILAGRPHVLRPHRDDRVGALRHALAKLAWQLDAHAALGHLDLAAAGRGDLDDAAPEQVGDADEVADIGVDRPGVDFVRPALLLDAALAHHDDLVAQ